MKSILLTINGKSVNVPVETADLTKEQRAELKALGVNAETMVKFGGGSVQGFTKSELDKAEQAGVKFNELASELSFS